MKIKYRNNILQPNRSKYCIHCAIYENMNDHRTCVGLCSKTHVFEGFNISNDCEVLEL